MKHWGSRWHDFQEILHWYSHGPQRMNPNDFGDSLTFPLAPQPGQNVYTHRTFVAMPNFYDPLSDYGLQRHLEDTFFEPLRMTVGTYFRKNCTVVSGERRVIPSELCHQLHVMFVILKDNFAVQESWKIKPLYTELCPLTQCTSPHTEMAVTVAQSKY